MRSMEEWRLRQGREREGKRETIDAGMRCLRFLQYQIGNDLVVKRLGTRSLNKIKSFHFKINAKIKIRRFWGLTRLLYQKPHSFIKEI